MKQPGKGAVPTGEERPDPHNREIYGRVAPYDADEGGNRDPERSQGSKERWKRKF